MKNGYGLTKAQTMEMVQSIDLVGLTLCLSQSNNQLPPKEVQSALITMLGVVRHQLAMSYGIDIDPCAVARGEVDLRSQMTPAEVADEILRDLENDES